MKQIFVVALLLLSSCTVTENKPEQQPQRVWKPVVVKKKYSENSVTKDLVFGTGNWHSTDYYIVDVNNKIWDDFSKDVYILCDVGDTLWTYDDWFLYLNKQQYGSK